MSSISHNPYINASNSRLDYKEEAYPVSSLNHSYASPHRTFLEGSPNSLQAVDNRQFTDTPTGATQSRTHYPEHSIFHLDLTMSCIRELLIDEGGVTGVIFDAYPNNTFFRLSRKEKRYYAQQVRHILARQKYNSLHNVCRLPALKEILSKALFTENPYEFARLAQSSSRNEYSMIVKAALESEYRLAIPKDKLLYILEEAALTGNTGIVKTILHPNSSFVISPIHIEMALTNAATQGHLEIITTLLALESKLTFDGSLLEESFAISRALVGAASKGHLRAMKTIFEKRWQLLLLGSTSLLGHISIIEPANILWIGANKVWKLVQDYPAVFGGAAAILAYQFWQ